MWLAVSELRNPKPPKTSEEKEKDDGKEDAELDEISERTDFPQKTLHDVHQMAFEKLKGLRLKYGKNDNEEDLDDFDLEDLEDFDLSEDGDSEDDDWRLFFS